MIEKKAIKCNGCGKIHEVDDLGHYAESYADEFFPKIWKEGKNELKAMSKKEVAEQMYFLGVKHFMETVNHNIKDTTKEPECDTSD